jgi:hypothetical protein
MAAVFLEAGRVFQVKQLAKLVLESRSCASGGGPSCPPARDAPGLRKSVGCVANAVAHESAAEAGGLHSARLDGSTASQRKRNRLMPTCDAPGRRTTKPVTASATQSAKLLSADVSLTHSTIEGDQRHYTGVGSSIRRSGYGAEAQADR